MCLSGRALCTRTSSQINIEDRSLDILDMRELSRTCICTLTHSQTNQDISISPPSWLYDSRRHLSVSIARTSEAEASAAGLTSYLILFIKACHPHLMPLFHYRKTHHNYSPVCRACQRPTATTLHQVIIAHVLSTRKQYLTHTCKEEVTCAHMRVYTAWLAWPWQMIRCSDACCHGDSRARDLRWECDFRWSVLSLVIFLYS